MDRTLHWDNVYETKNPQEVSWTQEIPETSLKLINSFNLSREAKIIDIGGGDSKLVDFLLDDGFENITVLDISEKALNKAKNRLGNRSKSVNWIVSDITKFKPKETYDVWHDRAAFHFLTNDKDITKYKQIANQAVLGFMIIGTFSINGPSKCSGLDVKQYDEKSLTKTFEKDFEKIECISEDHTTPFSTYQNFLFCSFRKKVDIK